MTEIIVSRFPQSVACIECEEKHVESITKIYDLITRCYHNKQFFAQQTPSAKAAKAIAKDFEWVNNHVNFPVDFIQKGKYLIIISKDSPNNDIIRDIPNTSHAIELFIAVMNGGDEAVKRILESRELGVEPKTKIHKDGRVELQCAYKED